MRVCCLLFAAAVFREGVGQREGLVSQARWVCACRKETCVAAAGWDRALFYFRVWVRRSLCSHNDGGEQKQKSTRAAGALVLSEAGVSMQTCRRRRYSGHAGGECRGGGMQRFCVRCRIQTCHASPLFMCLAAGVVEMPAPKKKSVSGSSDRESRSRERKSRKDKSSGSEPDRADDQDTRTSDANDGQSPDRKSSKRKSSERKSSERKSSERKSAERTSTERKAAEKRPSRLEKAERGRKPSKTPDEKKASRGGSGKKKSKKDKERRRASSGDRAVEEPPKKEKKAREEREKDPEYGPWGSGSARVEKFRVSELLPDKEGFQSHSGHWIEEKIKCPVCWQLKPRSTLGMHLESNTYCLGWQAKLDGKTVEKSFACGYCWKTFFRKEDLDQHRNACGKQPPSEPAGKPRHNANVKVLAVKAEPSGSTSSEEKKKGKKEAASGSGRRGRTPSVIVAPAQSQESRPKVSLKSRTRTRSRKAAAAVKAVAAKAAAAGIAGPPRPGRRRRNSELTSVCSPWASACCERPGPARHGLCLT